MECFFINGKGSCSQKRSSCDQLLAPTTTHFQFCIPDASRQAIFAWIWGSLPRIRPLHLLIFFLAGVAGTITTSASAHNFIISKERNNSNNPHLASYCIAG